MDAKIIYPLGKKRAVTIDPSRQFGAPCVRFRLPTECLYNLFAAGDTMQIIAKWYEITEEQVHDAVQYEVMRRCRHGRKAIKQATKEEIV